MLHTMSEDDGALLELLDALSELRRFWERPDRKRRFLAELGEPVELATLRTLAAVERSEAAADGEPGVCDVAEHLAVDASTASRLAEQAVRPATSRARRGASTGGARTCSSPTRDARSPPGRP
jgi:hypothetical protein